MDANAPVSTATAAIALLLHACLLWRASRALQPYDLLYQSGVEAFYSSDYSGVVRYMEEALSSYSQLRRTKVRCALRCEEQHPVEEEEEESASELRFFYTLLRRASCLGECVERSVGAQSVHRVSEDVTQDFHRRIPYNFLQLAYRKVSAGAVAAAHTYFQANPEHVEMGEHLEQYKLLEGVKEEDFIDREARQHQKAFTMGVKHYDSGDYEKAIEHFEEALLEYFNADVECRVLCEGPQKFADNEHLHYRPSLYELISDHLMQVLHCKHECVRDLATRPGRLSPMENYLPLHYDYLQFAYFKANKVSEALECAQSYLLFHKGEEFMMENMEHYREVLGHDMKPRQVKHIYILHSFCFFIQQLCKNSNICFSFLFATMLNTWRRKSGKFPKNFIHCHLPIFSTCSIFSVSFVEGGPLLYSNVQLVQKSEDLNGSQRVLLDNVISEDECTELKDLAHSVTMAGDGYRGKMSPHTPNEKFEGATVLKTLQYGYEGRIPLRSARLFYDVSEKARRIIESYFMLNTTLHFSYTHLVCRTAIQGQQEHRNDLSHPIHADNCLLDPEANECWKEPPAYTYRDYSALLYLNGDFDGGEFIFTEMDAKTVTASIKPKCGRMVGFSSGGENPHGVRAVTNGQRCAVALWFTLDPLFRELERLQADEVIQSLDSQNSWDQELNINPKDEL
uniref:procollagen-proline 3-dioxygenase n=1 Tax=Scleropages formosus TaxID=113540 RepID=A0A8C9TKI5_SCLFO